MRFFCSSVALSFCVFANFAFAATMSLISIEKYKGKTTGKHIIQFKSGVSYESSALFKDASSRIRGDITKLGIINGISGPFSEDTLNLLRSSPDVALVAEDGVMSIMATQSNAPWNLARISSEGALSGSPSALNFTYTYDGSGGKGVDIYVLDTGVDIKHPEFGGRATSGATFGGYADADGNGHGTHIAAIAAGSTYGVAKLANIIAVKVLSDSGSGSTSNIISGINWTIKNAESTGRPSVIILSLGGGVSTALDSAVITAVAAGLHVCVASGNSNVDASTSSPARVKEAITVAASTFSDERLSTGNYGPLIDFYAPGQSIISAWIGGGRNTLTGSSVATPHVAGLVAYVIGLRGNQKPETMIATLDSLSLRGVLKGVPSNTRNNLISNGYCALSICF